MRALVTGATGFIGRRLIEHLDEPVVLSRDPGRARAELPRIEAHFWDPAAGLPPSEAFAGAEAIFHLAGEPVGEGRWSEEKKRRIRDSRVVGTQNLVQAIGQLGQKPPALVAASAIGFYGSRGDEILDENSAPGNDFLAQVCRQWEAATAAAEKLGVRAVSARFGIVLGQGGALAKMLLPFKLGLGGRLGSGRQWMSWIHVDDVVGILLHAAQHSDVRGPVNTVSPAPVTNSDFTQALARVLHRPAIFPVPALALRLAVGGFSEVLLGSQRVVPRVAEQKRYVFQYADLERALTAAIKPPVAAQPRAAVKTS